MKNGALWCQRTPPAMVQPRKQYLFSNNEGFQQPPKHIFTEDIEDVYKRNNFKIHKLWSDPLGVSENSSVW